MGWKNDSHGFLFKSGELKLYRRTHTWGMKLSQLDKQSGTVRIVTYRLPGGKGDPYYEAQIARRPMNMFVLIGVGDSDSQVEHAKRLKDRFPNVRVAVHNTLHIKAVSIEPKTLYVGSANFGNSSWSDLTLGVRSAEAHEYFVDSIFVPLWDEAAEL